MALVLLLGPPRPQNRRRNNPPFAVLNKVAGVYGLIAVLTGAGGSFAQLSMYIYSVLGLIALGWGLKVVKAEDARQTLYLAIYSLQTTSCPPRGRFTLLFGGGGTPRTTEPVRPTRRPGGLEAARLIWDQEKGLAFAVILVSWLSKNPTRADLPRPPALLLRHPPPQRLLPLPRPHPFHAPTPLGNGESASALPEDDLVDEEIEDFYRVPLRTPTKSSKHAAHPTSVSSFTDFVGAGDSKRTFILLVSPPSNKSILAPYSLNGGVKPPRDLKTPAPADGATDDDDEVLFDTDDPYPYTSSGSTSKTPSKRGGTETSTSGSRSAGSSVDGDDAFRNRSPKL
ncbi:hypothetical protein K438DRAFT_1988070 [Mycena galopus ATCC 62051]|nr:hypothetical protein K438DRAFT_1988070 [Mycena galopus ATCC 62051]